MKQTNSPVNIQSESCPQAQYGVYLDCNATSPLEPAVRDLLIAEVAEELGNAGSRTHEYGTRAKNAVEAAREHVASVASAKMDEVVFTSGATESNNIALLGLSAHGHDTGRKHIVTTAIEHKAVLEPLAALASEGFEITYVPPTGGGYVEPDAVENALRPDTLAVSVMHVNNETGIRQPIAEIARLLEGHDTYFHVDAAQGFGKIIDELQDERIDLLSISSHKMYGPVGIGSLVTRKRGFKRPPLKPLLFGGGQERGLRPGTLPVPLIAGFGLAAALAEQNWRQRRDRCAAIRSLAIQALTELEITIHGDQSRVLPHVLNFSVPGLDSEAVMLSLKGIAAVSNGSACTSQSYTPSHVLAAMGLQEEEIAGAVRLSWCHLTGDVNWPRIAETIKSLQ